MPSALRRRAAVVWIGFCGLLLAVSALDPDGVAKWARLSKQARGLDAENRDIERENERLRRDARALAVDPAAVERAAREDLGYVRPGEIILKLDEEPRP